jgi:hypothetical protein
MRFVLPEPVRFWPAPPNPTQTRLLLQASGLNCLERRYETLKKEKAAKTSAALFGGELGGGGVTPFELSMAIGTNVRVKGAQSAEAVQENRYLAPIANAERKIREREERHKEQEARREQRRSRTEAKQRKRQERAARKIQRSYRCHRFRVNFAKFMMQREAVTWCSVGGGEFCIAAGCVRC